MDKERYAKLVLRKNLTAVRAAALRFERAATPDAVHDLRVSLRRQRTLLKALEGLVDAVLARQTRRALKILGRRLGAARDRHIFLTHIRSSDRALAAHLRRSERRRTDAARRLLPECLGTEARLASALLPVVAPFPAPSSYVRWARSWMKRRRRKIHGLIEAARGMDDRRLHRARIETKKLRYVAETLPDSKAARKVVGAARDLQTMLGDLHDLKALEGYLRRRKQPKLVPRMRQARASLFEKNRAAIAGAPRVLKRALRDV